MAVDRIGCDLQCMLNQALMSLGAGTQAEAVLPELNRSVVVVRQAVDQLSAHDGSDGMAPRSMVVK